MEYRKEQIKNHESYQIDTNGVVYSKSGKPLKPATNSGGYKYVSLFEEGVLRSYTVHRLVALQFIEGRNEMKNCVNHIDGNKLNNRVENLEWVTLAENVIHARDVIKTLPTRSNHRFARKVIAYDTLTGKTMQKFDSLSEAAEFFTSATGDYKITKVSIWKALSGRRKTYRDLAWQYADDN